MAIKLSDVLCKIAEYVEYEGTSYPVKAIGATGVQLAERIGSPNPPSFDELFALAKSLCPSLPAPAWEEDAAIVGIVIEASQRRVKDVQAELPNSSGPATPTPPAIESHAP